jgi:hypothetical protein
MKMGHELHVKKVLALCFIGGYTIKFRFKGEPKDV